MLIDLLMCKCEEESCEHEFITNSYEDLSCPSCGSENVFGTWKKASVFESFKFSDVNSEKELQAKINKEVSKINDMVKNYNIIKETIIQWFEKESYNKPKEVIFKISRGLYYAYDKDDYVLKIDFDGVSSVNSDKLKELIDDLHSTYSAEELNKINNITL